MRVGNRPCTLILFQFPYQLSRQSQGLLIRGMGRGKCSKTSSTALEPPYAKTQFVGHGSFTCVLPQRFRLPVHHQYAILPLGTNMKATSAPAGSRCCKSYWLSGVKNKMWVVWSSRPALCVPPGNPCWCLVFTAWARMRSSRRYHRKSPNLRGEYGRQADG